MAVVRLLAPLLPPVILTGENDWDHRDEEPEVDQKEPESSETLFARRPGDPALYDFIVTKKLDDEVELAVVIWVSPGARSLVAVLSITSSATVANDGPRQEAVPHLQGG